MQSMKKASEAEVDKTSASTSKAGPSKQSVELSDPNKNYIRTLRLPITRMLNLWKRTSMVLLFYHGSGKVCSPIIAPNTRIFIPNTRILSLITKNNIKGCVLLEPRNTRTKRNTRFGQNTFHSFHLQRRISPLSLLKSLLSLKRLLLSKTNNKIIQTQSFTGR